MHVVITTLYGIVAWLSLLAWAVIAGPPGAALAVLVLAPFVVSGVVLLLLAWCTLRWLWLSRGTLRLWRSPRSSFRGRVPRAAP